MDNRILVSERVEAKVKALDQELNRLFLRYACFCQLFKGEESVAFLSKTAAAFRVIQDSVLFDILFAVMRLVDPRRSAGQDNLCFAAVLNDILDAGV